MKVKILLFLNLKDAKALVLVVASRGGKKADLQLLAIELWGHVTEWILSA